MFFTLTALAFILWLMAVVMLFLIKVAIGTTGALYYGTKSLMEFLMKILTRIATALHVGSIFKNLQNKLPLQ